jgi:hypothetical protein
VPSQKEVEEYLLRRRKEELLEKFNITTWNMIANFIRDCIQIYTAAAAAAAASVEHHYTTCCSFAVSDSFRFASESMQE